MAKNKPNTVQIAERIAEPVLAQLGLTLWDVRFEKEGSSWFLRYFIDREGGVTIDDCERFSRAVDPLLDAADPVEQAYYLEVSSPGIERELTRAHHFAQSVGKRVLARLVRPRDGIRELTGELVSYDGERAVVRTAQGDAALLKNETAYIRLVYDYDNDKGATQ